jgi:prolyl 4-hydroxylase
MHHENISTNYAYLPHNIDPTIPTPAEYVGMPINPLGPQAKERYDEYIRGCVDYYNNDPKHQHHKKGNRCIHGEAERIEMTLRQPKSVYNYTETGFTKIRAPENVYKLIKEFWDKNRGKETLENWIREFFSCVGSVGEFGKTTGSLCARSSLNFCCFLLLLAWNL